MRQVANCPNCGTLYIKNAFGLCQKCQKDEEENELIVADYVREHPNCSLQQIHHDTGVREKTILRMIQTGRLIEVGTVSYACESCGASITSGRLCQKCNQKLIKEIDAFNKKSTEQKNSPNKGQGVGFLAKYYETKK